MEFTKSLIEQVNSIKNEFAHAYNEIDKATRIYKEKTEQLKKTGADLKEEVYTKRKAEIFNAYEGEIINIAAELEKAKAEAVAKVEEITKGYYLPKGEEISDSNFKLFNSSIALTDDEISEMIKVNANNPTMLRLLSKHAEANKIKLSVENEKVFATVRKAGAKEQDIFKQFLEMASAVIKMAENGSAGTETYIRTQMKLDDYVMMTHIKFIEAKPYLTIDDHKEAYALEEKLELYKKI